MDAIRFWRPLAALCVSGAWLASGHAAAVNPPIQMAQGIEYMCGGKNTAEADFMKMVSPRWAATLEFAVVRSKSGDMPEDVKVVVRDRYSGAKVMEATAGAPVMLARLDPGAYEVEATLAGLTLRQPLVVFNGQPASARFNWPSNVDYASITAAARQPERQATAKID